MMWLGCFLALFSLLSTSGAQDVVVDTEYGPVRGTTVAVDNGKELSTVHAFNGVPFAKDTSGPRRFKKPEKRDPWGPDVLDALVPGDACPQGMAILMATNPGWSRRSEDCLHLQIITPDVNGGPYPVMFYIYGGGYQSGANFQYPGHFQATHGVVSVNVNYRLGTFGFAYTGNEAAPGNLGLWDQRMGLQFVIDNIANFGGDPNQITLYGESAGATSTGYQLLSPQSKDMFQRAIFQSGADTSNWSYSPPESNPERQIRRVADQLNCNVTDDFLMIECLQALTWENIYYNSSGMFNPVIDGPGGFLPKTPAELREDGDIMRGPIMSGVNSDESSMTLMGMVPEAIFGCCNRSYYMHVLRTRFVGWSFADYDEVTQENIVQAMDHTYTEWPYMFNNDMNRQALIDINTDDTFGEDWDRQIKLHSKIAPTYGFIFGFRGQNTSALIPEWMGVPHLGELPYVHGFTLIPRNDEVYNNTWVNFDLIDWTEQDVEYTYFTQTLWANFAKYGNPTPEPVENPLGGSTIWPPHKFDDGDLSILMIKNDSIDATTFYRQTNYAFWNEYLPYLTGEETEDFFGDYTSYSRPHLNRKHYEDDGNLEPLTAEEALLILIDAKRTNSGLFEDGWEDW